MRDLTISLIQTTQFWEDKSKNIANISAIMMENFSTDLILLPEMFNTAFSMDARNLAESMALSPSLNQLKIWAKQKNAAIYTSMMVKDGEQFFNRGVFIYPNGEFVHYDKRNLFALGGEGGVFSPGKEEKIVDYWNTFDELNNNKRWTTRIMSQLNFMNQLDESHRFPGLLDYIEKLDSIRPIKFSQQYKDYYEILRS